MYDQEKEVTGQQPVGVNSLQNPIILMPQDVSAALRLTA
jgi:hypothetical protein